MRYLGFCPVQISTAPQEVISYLAAQLHVPSETLGAYGSRAKTRQGHVQEVLSYLGFRRFQPDDQDALQDWLLERALEHDKPTLLLHMACEHLKQQQLMRPGVTILERLVVSARLQAHHESFRRLQPLLSQPVMDFLDSLLALEPDSGRTTLYTLRQHATTNTPAALVKALDKRRSASAMGHRSVGPDTAQPQPSEVPGPPRTQVYGASLTTDGARTSLSDPGGVFEGNHD